MNTLRMFYIIFFCSHPDGPFCFPLKFGTRFIIEAMEAAGHSISTLFLCGGLSKNPLFVQMHADITGKSKEEEGRST